MVIGLIINWSY